MKDRDKLLITDFTYWQTQICPIFLYYLKPVPEIMFLDKTNSVNDVLDAIRKNKISWVVIISSPDKKGENIRILVKKLETTSLRTPITVGWSYVWKTDGLEK